jgi:hypothetical protein
LRIDDITSADQLASNYRELVLAIAGSFSVDGHLSEDPDLAAAILEMFREERLRVQLRAKVACVQGRSGLGVAFISTREMAS